MTPIARFLLAVTVALTVVVAARAAEVDLGGRWAAEFNTEVGIQKYVYTFAVDGETVTGRADSNPGKSEIKAGKLVGSEPTFTETLTFEGMPLTITYKGIVAGDEIRFTRNVADYAVETFVAKRVKE